MNILVSACLLGNACRFDAKSRPCNEVIALSKKHRLIPVCPEMAGGLSVPRCPSEIVGDRVISKEGRDCTEQYKKGAEVALSLAREYGCRYAVLKLKSPSCGTRGVYDGSFTRTLNQNKKGITAELLCKNGITVLGEDQTHLICEE